MATDVSIYAGAAGTGLIPFLPLLSQHTTAQFLILGVLFLFTVLYYFVPYGLSPLNRYPGPFLAALSNYWRMYYAARGSMHLKIKSLHNKYGPVVRTAPNQIDLDCPSLIRTCFERQGRFQKTEFYSVSGVKQAGVVTYNIFSETSSTIHAQMKKPIAKYYSSKSVLGLEPKIDEIITHLTYHLDNRFVGEDSSFGPVFDFGRWLLYLTWDLVGQVTFSRPFGYLDRGFDFDGTLRSSRKAIGYLSIVGMQPSLDYFLDKNPIYRIGPPGFNTLVDISLEQLGRRTNGTDKHNESQADFLDHFIEAKASSPDIVDDQKIISYLLINMAAGADTTAITLRSIFYLSLKHPQVWARLEKEVLAATKPGRRKVEDAPVSFQTARAITYLEAVTRESLRLYPGNCFSMDRYVPKGGLYLPDGSLVPEGTAVGFNAYVINRNQDIWGPDAECFVPERWLRDEDKESEEEHKQRIANLMKYDLSFGGGNRKCIGMHLGLMEVYKIAATLIQLYEFELVSKRWKVFCHFFPYQSDFRLRIKRRE